MTIVYRAPCLKYMLLSRIHRDPLKRAGLRSRDDVNTNLLSGRMNRSETKMVYQHEHISRSTGPDMQLSRGPQQQIYFSMSSPTSSGEYPPAKRRRVSPHGYDPSVNVNGVYSPSSTGNAPPAGGGSQLPIPHAAGPIHSVSGQPVILQQVITKRGARACTACRKGKNRCEGDVSGPLFPSWRRACPPAK
jgi:hypothetical protein